jgi:thioesterase domain-containing protein/acyl carrier protein
LDALPLLPSGKIDRHALPLPEWSRGSSAKQFVPPTSETEKKLARIWEEILKLDRVGITDNFFDLGGHSLLAVRVINRIEDLIEGRLSVAQFFENPTIGALTALIRPRRHTEEEPYILHVQTEGKRRPFFCMADVEYMFALAKALGPEQPFYGMRIPGLGQEEIPLDTIEAMASYCVRAIERTDPKGPYLIGGHCFGGIVAFEVAQQLTRKGKAVDLLVMLAPDSLTELRRRKIVRFWMYRLWYDVKRRRVMEAIRNRLEALTSILASLWKRGQYLKLKRYNDARSRAREQYKLSPYSGRVLFIWSSERVAPPSAYKEQIHQVNPWLNAAKGDVRKLAIEGTHTGIFQEPGLRRLAEELRSEFGASEPAQGAE